MAGQRQDYILRQVELLRQALARLLHRRDHATLESALQLAFHLQEKLFAMPPAEFLQKPVADQVAELLRGESKASGQEKCLTYAQLLEHTAQLYDYRDRPDLARGARQLALHVALHVALDEPADPGAVRDLVTRLLGAVDPLELPPPVRALLDAYIGRTG